MKVSDIMSKVKSTPARSPEARENQMINLAMKLAESQLRDGSATSQVITHFLKLATVREQLENERLRAELRVADAKIKQMESAETSKELYSNAIAAFKSYSGQDVEEEDDEW